MQYPDRLENGVHDKAPNNVSGFSLANYDVRFSNRPKVG